MNDSAARELVGRVEGLLEDVEGLPDPAGRATATEVVAAILDMYGEGLGRMVELIAERETNGLAEAMAGDELVSHLLLLHDLHPVPLEARVREALEEVRPYLESHGGNVELVEIAEGVVRVRLEGSCDGCPSSAMTLKLAIEEAIHKAAPEVESVEPVGGTPQPQSGLLQLTVAGGARTNGAAENGARAGTWATAGALPELSSGATIVKPVAGEPLLFLRVEETLYAYRPACPTCAGSLEGAALSGDEVACPACGERYDARRAGRSLEGAGRQLTPVPLLVDDAGLVKVAVGAAAA